MVPLSGDAGAGARGRRSWDSCIVLSLTPEDRRRAPRHHLGRVAAITFGPGAVQHYCLVTDFSEGGVRLHVKQLTIPDEFSLLFSPGGAARSGNYKVMWRRGQDIGAKLIETG
jgi:PilZ domain